MDDARVAARAFSALFPRAYLLFHRKLDPARDRITPESFAMLQHLAHAGPLTVGEMARHLDRAQSVVSETVAALESRGLLARMRDERDRRRTLVWLTTKAHAWLERQRSVLDAERVARAMATVTPRVRAQLIEAFEALLAAAEAQTREGPSSPSPQAQERKR